MSESRGIQSIEVGGLLLQCLIAAGRPMGLKELAQAAGMGTSKAHPYLASFGRLGLVSQDESTGLYGLGSMALELGLASLRQLDPIRVVTPLAEALALEVGQSVALSVWGNHGPTVVRLIESTAPIHVNMRPGTVMEMTQTATGLVFAAWLPEHRIQGLMRREARALSANANAARELLEEMQRRVIEARKRGIGRAVGRPIPGVNAFAAPVLGPYGEVTLVVTALGPAASFGSDWSSPVAAAVRQVAERATRLMGGLGEGGLRDAGDSGSLRLRPLRI
jgi:DNA-binding IclR family transcriptional regulator